MRRSRKILRCTGLYMIALLGLVGCVSTQSTAIASPTPRPALLSFPKERWWTRALLGVGNLMLRLGRREFQIFLHSPDNIIATAELHGLGTNFNRTGYIWQVISLRRTRVRPGSAGRSTSAEPALPGL